MSRLVRVLAVAAIALFPTAARASHGVETIIDLSSVRALGNPNGLPWDVTYQPPATDSAGNYVQGPIDLGSRTLGDGFVGGTPVLCGWDIMFGMLRGWRVGMGLDVALGSIEGLPDDWRTQGAASLFDGFLSIGYRYAFGRLRLHTSTVVRGDYFSMTATTSGAPAARSLSSSMAPPPPSGASLDLSSFGMDVGQEAGLRVELMHGVWLYTRGELDVDAQWQGILGVGFGEPAN